MHPTDETVRPEPGTLPPGGLRSTEPELAPGDLQRARGIVPEVPDERSCRLPEVHPLDALRTRWGRIDDGS